VKLQKDTQGLYGGDQFAMYVSPTCPSIEKGS